MSQYAYLSEPDAEMAAAIAKLPPNRPVVDIEKARKGFESSIANFMKVREPQLPPGESYRLQDYLVPVDGGEIAVRSLVPTPDDVLANHTFPLLLWIHGGGWALGNIKIDDYNLRQVCVELQLSILSVEYRLAPEHPFPTGLNDCYTALKWAVENHAILKASLHKGLLVGGSSAGANMSAVIAHRARDDQFFHENPVTGQLLQIPHKQKLLSIEQNKNAPILPKENIFVFADHYKAPLSDPEVSVLLHPNHKALSPAYIQVAGFDPLRDEGFLYEEVLREAGVRTRLDSYQGLPHGVHNYFPQVGVCQKFDRDFKEGLRWLLDRDAVTAA
ncbi:hypothetical protein NLI96_g3103 [Meripilus lineatus]|uniref:Alpha/beta hydrolase fold-3 domain-containing protein n=1 Tax=Meripilus lineatus TaxID=2056292 RepID=A0AAD5V9K9_9APHY|nr:hypothetical protein NLI96_g3103 [Physisporinus lineatus]